MRKYHFKLIFGILLILVLLIGAGSYLLFYQPFSSHREHSYIYIDKDDNIDSVYTKMEEAARPHQMWGVKITAVLLGYDKTIKTGKYEVGDGLNSLTVIRNLRNKHQVPVRLTIPSVRTLERLSAQLDLYIAPDSAAIMQCLRDSNICHQYGYDTATISCIFIPNTYEVYWDITPENLLNKMQTEYEKFWTKERQDKAASKNLTQTEVITLASIVDQETAYNPEKPAIAGMYLNRLKKGMPLQADPTVKFALKKFGLRRILHEHLKTDSPYNTYRYAGLPPGPISIPDISSIDAVLNAEDNNYLFMCAKEDFSGSHNFAKTYGEHLKNARKYTRALNERGIK